MLEYLAGKPLDSRAQQSSRLEVMPGFSGTRLEGMATAQREGAHPAPVAEGRSP